MTDGESNNRMGCAPRTKQHHCKNLVAKLFLVTLPALPAAVLLSTPVVIPYAAMACGKYGIIALAIGGILFFCLSAATYTVLSQAAVRLIVAIALFTVHLALLWLFLLDLCMQTFMR